MAKFDSYAPGQFSWTDLMTPDTGKAAAFYGALFGWTADATSDDGGGAYTMFRLGGADVAGMGAMPAELQKAGVPAHWNSYVSVEDADAAAARAGELGGKLEMPVVDIRVDGALVGRMTFVSDPEGARIALWQPGAHAGSGLANVPGSFCWNELCSRDVDAAARFYGALFGWEIRPGDAENGYREIELNGRANGGILPWQPEMGEVPAAWTTYFAVADCDAAVARVKQLGGALLAGPIDIEPGRFAVVCDDQGAVFSVIFLANPDD